MNELFSHMAPHRICLRVYDTTVAVCSDAPAVLEILVQMYRRFLVAEGDATAPTLTCVALTQPAPPWPHPVIVLGGRVYPLRDRTIVEGGYFHALVMEAVFHHIRSHLLFHAGALAYGDAGIVLVGDSTHGKSTLVLSLLQQGYRFLSDDIAALRRQDGRLCAFPRTLWIRSGTLDLLDLSHLRRQQSLWLDKLIVDAEAIRPCSIAGAVPLRYLFLLAAPQGPVPAVAGDPEITLLLDHVDPELLCALRRLEGVQALDVVAPSPFPQLRLQTADAPAVLAQVRRLCEEKAVLLLDVVRRPVAAPSFTQPPRLSPLAGSAAAMELLRHFQPGHGSAVLQEAPAGRGTRLFVELVSLLQTVRCYRLSVGPLPQMMALVRDLVEAPDAEKV